MGTKDLHAHTSGIRPHRRVARALGAAAAVVVLSVGATACGESDGDTLPDAPGDTVPTTAAVTTVETPTTRVETTTVETTPATRVGSDTTDAGSPAGSPQEQLDTARRRWADAGPTSYRMVTQELCYCPQEQWAHTIVDGEEVAREAVTDDAFSDPGPLTMTDLFDRIQTALDEGYASIDLSFDATTGAVESYFVDVEEMIADEEYGVAVESVEPVDG